jgi:uncharacterized membrane protein YhaH (DUF805 family)
MLGRSSSGGIAMGVLTRPWRHYADFAGRSRRTEYFLFFICWYSAMVLGVMLGIGVAGSSADELSESASLVMITVSGIIFVAGIIPALAVAVRRMHDQDKSGWLILVNFIPYVGGLIMLVLAFLPGTDGENQYGPDPRNPVQARADVFR